MLELRVNTARLSPGAVEPGTTLLGYLRNTLGLTGTKEGCASGDCGACTVVIGRLDVTESTAADERMVIYRTINSCVTPLASLHGTQILTVEGVGTASEHHPVQQAMVDHHASQCGFCTPGFVMSLVGLGLMEQERLLSAGARAKTDLTTTTPSTATAATTPVPAIPVSSFPAGTVSASTLRPALGGNLCRCTGYRSIIDAGVQALCMPPAPLPGLTGAVAALREINRQTHTPVRLQDYLQPASEAELQRLLGQTLTAGTPARLINGGTDLWLEVTQQYRQPGPVIDVSGIETLNQITLASDRLRIGAAVTHERLLDLFGPQGLVPCTAIVAMLHRFASPQIRHRGSLGGNLANGSPIADWPPILLALDADVVIGSHDGTTIRVPMNAFNRGYRRTVLEPGQYLQAVEIPQPLDWQTLSVYKITKRHEDDISSVLGAFCFRVTNGRITHARIAFGGVAAVPLRLPAAEALLIGQTPDSLVSGNAQEQALTSLVGSLLTPISDVRASAAYRSAMALALLRKALARAAGMADADLDAVQSA